MPINIADKIINAMQCILKCAVNLKAVHRLNKILNITFIIPAKYFLFVQKSSYICRANIHCKLL